MTHVSGSGNAEKFLTAPSISSTTHTSASSSKTKVQELPGTTRSSVVYEDSVLELKDEDAVLELRRF